MTDTVSTPAPVFSVPQERRIVTAVPGPKSQELHERRLAVVPTGVSSALPVYIAKANGAILVDVDGNQFVDFGAGIGVTTVGHTESSIVEAAAGQLQDVIHTLFTITPASVGVSGALWKPAISADGHLVAFWDSDAASAGGSGHLMAFDRSTGLVTTIASTVHGAGRVMSRTQAAGKLNWKTRTRSGGAVTREMDERRMEWAANDIIQNRPPLSRWHPDYKDAFDAFMKAPRK